MRKNFNAVTTKRKQHANLAETLKGNHSLGPLQKENLGLLFTVVRNPWDYAVSWYTFKIRLCKQYIKNIEENPAIENRRKEKFNLQAQKNQLTRLENLGFKEWVRQTKRDAQHWWAKDCDYIMRLENLNEDFLFIQQKLECYQPLGHLNPTGLRSKYKDYYTDQETIDIIAKKYKIDIETYGYDF